MTDLTTLFGVGVSWDGEGDHVMIAGEVGQGFRLFRIFLTFVVPTAPFVTVTFKSGSSDTTPSKLYVGNLGAISLGMESRRWFMSKAAGDAVICNVTGDPGVKIGGFLTADKTPWQA